MCIVIIYLFTFIFTMVSSSVSTKDTIRSKDNPYDSNITNTVTQRTIHDLRTADRHIQNETRAQSHQISKDKIEETAKSNHQALNDGQKLEMSIKHLDKTIDVTKQLALNNIKNNQAQSYTNKDIKHFVQKTNDKHKDMVNEQFKNNFNDPNSIPFGEEFEKHKQVAREYYQQLLNSSNEELKATVRKNYRRYFEEPNGEEQVVPSHQDQILYISNEGHKEVTKENYILPFQESIDKHKQITQVYYNQLSKDRPKEIVRENYIHPFGYFPNDMNTQIANEQPFENINLHKETVLYQPFGVGHKDMQAMVLSNGRNDVKVEDLYVPMLRRRIRLEEIPLVQKRRSQAEMMKLLDEYTLEKRKTNFVQPFSVNNLTNSQKTKRSLASSSDSDTAIKTSDSDTNNKYKIEITKSKVIKEKKKAKVFENNRRGATIDADIFEDFDMKELENPETLKALRDQTERMSDLISQIQYENVRKSAQSDFEQILKNGKDRRNVAKKQEKNSTTPGSTTEMLPMKEMLIDETMVKEALRNDPYIKRILKLSNQRREEYFKYRNKMKT